MQKESSNDLSIVKRGYDISQVDARLTALTAQVEESSKRVMLLEAELTEAKAKEEAVHLTLLAATKTKDELIGAAQAKFDEAAAEANAESERIISQAQYEAFRLVSEAKETAEDALTAATEESERVRRAAEEEADSRLSESRREAMAIVSNIEEESERLLAERKTELAELSDRFEQDHAEVGQQVLKLRAVARDIEARLRAVARGALEDLLEVDSLLESVDGELQAQTMEPAAEEHTVEEIEFVEPDVEVEDVRGSFYSRRSANLPRLGDAAAGNAVSAITALRPALDEEGEPSSRTNDGDSEVVDLVTA